MHDARPTFAAGDETCGDFSHDPGEQCEDGNLKNGDGCSNICTLEICGNKRVDVNEQCDDGNITSGDGCNKSCQIEFCSDRTVQPLLGEQCDDGNGVSGDGCSSSCQNESQVTPKPPVTTPTVTPKPPKTQPREKALTAVQQLLMAEAEQSAEFLASPEGKDILALLSSEEIAQLNQILATLRSGTPLSETQRGWITALVEKLQNAYQLEQERYTNLFEQLIGTALSAEILAEKGLDREKLVDVPVPVAIAELSRAVEVLSPKEIQSGVADNLAALRRQGISTDSIVSEAVLKNLQSSRAIDVVAALNSLKQSIEPLATTDLPASLETINAELSVLQDLLPVFEREYGIKTDELSVLLTEIQTVSKEVTKQDAGRVVSSIDRFFKELESSNVFSKAELASYNQTDSHAAANALRIAETVGQTDGIDTEDELSSFISNLAETAPEQYKETFSAGSTEAQRESVASFLETDERVQSLRALLAEDGRTDFELRFQELQRAIRSSGDGLSTASPCDDDVPSALQCTTDYLSDLQDAVRGRSTYTRIVGYFQDLFGIGNE